MTTADRGFAAVGLHMPKTPANVGSVLRAAHCYGVAMVAQTGQRYRHAPTDTMKAYRHLPLIHTDDLRALVPHDCVPVAIDLLPGARDLTTYTHPERAFYIFGPEDGTLRPEITSWCRDNGKPSQQREPRTGRKRPNAARFVCRGRIGSEKQTPHPKARRLG